MNTRIEMVEVAARDGLQNEPGFFPTADKLELIERMNPQWKDLYPELL